MPARVYILVADSPGKMQPTFLPAPGRPTHAACEVMGLEEFRRLDGPGFGRMLDSLEETMSKIRRGDVR